VLYTPDLQQRPACCQALQREPRLPVPLQLHDVSWQCYSSACDGRPLPSGAPRAVPVRIAACLLSTDDLVCRCMHAGRQGQLAGQGEAYICA
jgi:hypothetical protein